MTTFRDRLRARGRPQVTHPILVADRADLVVAEQQLVDAEAGLQVAQGGGDLAVVEHYEQAVAAARAAVAACYEHPTITALHGADMEELIGQHPPVDGGDGADGAQWDPHTFLPALLAECVRFGPDEPAWTADDWREELQAGSLSFGEWQALAGAAIDVNSRAPDPRTGKG